MRGYIDEVVDEFSKDITIPVVSPAADKSKKYLSEEWAILFHRLVTKSLFGNKRSRPKIHPTITYLTDKLRETSVQDCKNISRLIHYLYGTC